MKETETFRPSPTARINPRCDPMFKALFTQGTEESNCALQDFISALLGRNIARLELRPNEPPVESMLEMQMTFDVSVTFDDGEYADLEMQCRNRKYDYAVRSEIQAARLLNVNAKKGNGWSTAKTYQISVLNFEFDKDDKSPLSWYTMRKDTGGKLGDRLNVILFDLTKIRKLLGRPPEQLTKLEKWGLFLSYADDEKQQDYVKQIIRSEKGIMAAHFTVGTMSADEANWFRQNSFFIAERDRYDELHNTLQEGEHKRAVETARRMLARGKATHEEIAEDCGLTLSEVRALQAG